MLAAGVGNKPVLVHFILGNPISIIRQHGPLLINQGWVMVAAAAGACVAAAGGAWLLFCWCMV